MSMAQDTLTSVPGLEVGMLAEELGDLGLDGLRQKSTSAVAKNFYQRMPRRQLPCHSSRIACGAAGNHSQGGPNCMCTVDQYSGRGTPTVRSPRELERAPQPAV